MTFTQHPRGSSLDCATYQLERVVGARVPAATAVALVQYASKHGLSLSDAIRAGIAALGPGTRRLVTASRAGDDPAALVRQVAELLGMPRDSDPAAVVKAVQDLFASLNAAPDAAGAAADAKPLTASRARAAIEPWRVGARTRAPAAPKLTREEIAACKRALITPEDYAARKRAAVRRV
jgi:hypothetical protein